MHALLSTLSDSILSLLACLSQPDLNKVKYQAASPDEAALVSAAKEMGYGFLKGTPVLYQIKNAYSGEIEQWEILMVIEFNSTRKRMSVVCKSPEGKTLLLCKGADNIIMDRLKEGGEHLSPLGGENASISIAPLPINRYAFLTRQLVRLLVARRSSQTRTST